MGSSADPTVTATRAHTRSRLRRHTPGAVRALLAGAVALLGTLASMAVFAAAEPAPAAAAGPTVLGSGSSYAAVALDQWTAQMSSFYGDDINYQTSSSVIGLNEYAQGQLNFAASEIGYSTGQSAYTPTAPFAPYQYLPDVAGAECLMYNLQSVTGQQVTDLELDAPTVLGIFTGEILTWNAPQIAALNPGIALPDTPILKAYRTDPSGDNYIFSDYLSTLYPSQWNAFTAAMGTPAGAQAIYPTPSDGQGGQHGPYDITGFEGENGSDVSSEYVNDNPNSITYVETAYAQRLGRPCVALENAAGDFVRPSSEADAVALTQDELEPDLEQILTGVFLNANPVAYPISAYSYLVTQENGQPSPAIGAVLGQFVQFIACRGQDAAATLGYSPIPPNLVADDFAAVNRLNGATPLPTPTASNCPNPYLTGQLPLPGEPIQLGGGSAGAGATAGGASTGSVGGGAGSGSSASGSVTSAGAASSPGSQGLTELPNGVSTQTAAAAAAATTRRVVQELKRRRSPGTQVPGLAEANAADRLLGQPGPTGPIVAWSLGALAVFAVVPLFIAATVRKRRFPRTVAQADVEGPR